jgi:hypothetical protein
VSAGAEVLAAERQTRVAADAVAAAESKLSAGGSGVSAGRLHQLRDRMRHASLAAAGAADKAERERLAARMASLGELGGEIDAAAAAAGAGLDAAIRAVGASIDAVRVLCAEHDARVRDLQAAAADLGAEPASPAGARATSAEVAADGFGITHGRVRCRLIGDDVASVLQHAIAGDVVSALAAAAPASGLPEHKRAAHHFFGPSGALLIFGDPLPEAVAAQAAAGTIRALTAGEIARYEAGELA